MPPDKAWAEPGRPLQLKISAGIEFIGPNKPTVGIDFASSTSEELTLMLQLSNRRGEAVCVPFNESLPYLAVLKACTFDGEDAYQDPANGSDSPFNIWRVLLEAALHTVGSAKAYLNEGVPAVQFNFCSHTRIALIDDLKARSCLRIRS